MSMQTFYTTLIGARAGDPTWERLRRLTRSGRRPIGDTLSFWFAWIA